MPYVTVAPPAGFYRNGTQYQSRGRWYGGNLMRFQEGQRKPVGGWQLRSAAGAMRGTPRSLISWRDNSNNRWIGIGTNSRLYIQNEAGDSFDVTPIRKTSTLSAGSLATTNAQTAVVVTDAAHGAVVGDSVIIASATAVGGIVAADLNGTQIVTAVTTNTWTFQAAHAATSTTTGGGTPTLKYEITPGRADATQNLGYGGGTYGGGTYGTPAPNTSAYLPVTYWSLDTWGEHLLACSDSDGSIYEWSLTTSTPAAAVSGAPTSCKGVVVTPERFVFALGASGNGRRVAWCDQEVNTTWTAASTNQAGDFDLQTGGTLMCGRAMRGQTLLLTDVDAHVATYIGTPLVYRFDRVGSGCGIIARGAIAARDVEAAWMGNGAFWLYDGQSVQPLDCDVADYVFSDINANQISKVAAVHNTAFGEVWWFYPSSNSNENDRYVCWAYRESQRLQTGVWTFGQLSRTAGTGRGVFPLPLMADASGFVYEHERGWSYDSAAPYLETGPIEIGNGDFMGEIQSIIPDEKTAGDVNATIYGRMWPNGAETTLATVTLASPTDLLVQAREIRVRYTAQQLTDFRIGDFRMEVIRGDPI